jgi:hypothetical protein
MKKKGLLIGIAGVAAALLILIAMAPAIISSDAIRLHVLKMVNQQIPGRLQIEAWSLNWFGKIQISGLLYDDRQNNLGARIADLNTSSGLFDLILGSGNLGTVEVIEPHVAYHVPRKRIPSESEDGSPAPQRPVADQRKDERAGIPAIFGRLKIVNGSITAVSANGDNILVAQNLNADMSAPGPEDPLTYQFEAHSGDGSGRMTAKGTLSFASDDPLDIQRIKSESKLVITSWQLDEVLKIFDSGALLPAAKGRLNANLALTGNAAESLLLVGDLSIPELKMYGGPLGSDTPVVNDVSVKLEAGGTPDAISLKDLTFNSSLANGSARGTFDTGGNHHLSGQADLDLAEISRQVPGTIKLREGTEITNGKMALSANLNVAGNSATFEGNARIDQIKGSHKKKNVSWNKPVTANAIGEVRPDGVQLKNLSLQSAFLNADGQGNLENMKVRLVADISAALREFRKFIELEQWDGSGNLKFNLDLKEKSKNISHAEVRAELKNFFLTREGNRILPKQDIQVDLNTTINIGQPLNATKLNQPGLVITSSIANGKISAAHAAWNAASAMPEASGLSFDTKLNLKQLSSVLKNLKTLKPDTSLEGESTIQSSGMLAKGRLQLDATAVDIRNLIYRKNKQTVREKHLTLATKGNLNFNTRSVYLAPIDIKGQAGTLQVPELKIADWSDAQKDLRALAKADLNLATLTESYGDFIPLPEKTQLSGSGKFDVDLDFSNPKNQYLKLQGLVSPFKLTSNTLPNIAERRVTIDAAVKRSSDGQYLTLENLKINANALKLTADGRLDQSGKNKIFEAQGSIAPDLKLVSEYLKKTAKTPIRIAGNRATPFSIKLVSKGGRWEDPLKHLNFEGGLYVDSIDAYGLSLTPKDVPIRLVNASANANLESPANGGSLALQPIVDLRKEPYVLSFKKNIDILKEVKVTQGLIDGLLAALHPLFKNAVMSEGILGLNLKNFNWPLSENGKKTASFAGTLELNGIRINSTPFLAQLLGIMGIQERELALNDQHIDFEARKGRVSCTPLTMSSGDYKMTLKGSIGFDETIDFIAQVPVTSKMVGKDAYRFLKGTTIQVPIGGTASKPRIDKTALQSATGDLMQQVLQKNVEQGVQDLFKNLFKNKN